MVSANNKLKVEGEMQKLFEMWIKIEKNFRYLHIDGMRVFLLDQLPRCAAVLVKLIFSFE